MTQALPSLTQFRVEQQTNGLIHLVFDCPDRTMNVFSNKAIHELGAFSEWLHRSDVRGVVIRSGKGTGFCAGADLTELGVAYDMIVAAAPADRFDMAFNHFFPLSHAIRRLETAGKPIAAAIAGVALGGGCELALGAHYRVGTTSKRAILGLPECAVGLLPGAGGTQRMPRVIGIEAGLEVLLLGRTLQGQEALTAGLLNEIVEEGEEITAAERWLLSDKAHSVQPWDMPDAAPALHSDIAENLDRHRARELGRMLGHEPAPLAILDCVELGFIQPIDGAIRAEMSVFAKLIQRAEARNMIRTMFLAKQATDKAVKAGTISDAVLAAVEQVAALIAAAPRNLDRAGFRLSGDVVAPVQSRVRDDYWFTTEEPVNSSIRALARSLAPIAAGLSDEELLQADHITVRDTLIPAYLGGLSGLSSLAGE